MGASNGCVPDAPYVSCGTGFQPVERPEGCCPIGPHGGPYAYAMTVLHDRSVGDVIPIPTAENPLPFAPALDDRVGCNEAGRAREPAAGMRSTAAQVETVDPSGIPGAGPGGADQELIERVLAVKHVAARYGIPRFDIEGREHLASYDRSVQIDGVR